MASTRTKNKETFTSIEASSIYTLSQDPIRYNNETQIHVYPETCEENIKLNESALSMYKRKAIQAAKDLGYGKNCRLAIKNATSQNQVADIMSHYRKVSNF